MDLLKLYEKHVGSGFYFEEFEAAAAEIIKEFVEAVEAKAEEKMLMTGKLEGAHYAAMKELSEEL